MINIFVFILISGLIVFLFNIYPLLKREGRLKIFLLSTSIIIFGIIFAAIIDYELLEVRTIGRVVNDFTKEYLPGFVEFMKIPSSPD